MPENQTASPEVKPKIPKGSKGPRKVRALPNKDNDTLATAMAVSAKWSTTPAITLIWMDAAAFAAMVSAYEQAVLGRNMVRGERPLKTISLKQLDRDIEKAGQVVKAYTTGKYERRNCTDIYPVFGMIKEGGTYRLPRDRQKRLAALELMITGIASEGFGSKPHGTAFWTDMREQYSAALSASTGSHDRQHHCQRKKCIEDADT